MSFYTSLTGLNSATAQLAVTANNIANVGTAGFKRSRADFGDIFSTSPLQKSSSNIGQGVSLKQVSQEFSQGNISTSGNSLDLAITGDGFFPLRSPDGLQEIYTRNGAFTLNDQNNVVNSAGQRLLAASVDSSGKADLTNLSPLVIPPKTSGQAVETTKIQLGLNLPADSTVISAPFDRSNPATYNKSTAMTVYDSGGNGYLATVYYVKTDNASQASPYSRWQSYFYVGDTQVKPALQQATDKNGTALYINKYGEVRPRTDASVVPSSGKTELYTLNEQTKTQPSVPATAQGMPLETTTAGALTSITAADIAAEKTIDFKINVDSEVESQSISYTLVDGDQNPETLATHLEIAINQVLGTAPAPTDSKGVPLLDANGKPVSDARYGVTVSFSATDKRFRIASGTTGDASTIAIADISADTKKFLGLDDSDTTKGAILSVAAAPTQEAVRGKPSNPAVLLGDPLNISTTKSVAVTTSNQNFLVSVDGISKKISIPLNSNTTIDAVAAALEEAINGISDDTGRTIQGVKVELDPATKALKFTTGTTGDNASIQVSGVTDWGLANTTMKFGSTTEWTKLTQLTQNGTPQFVKNGQQTEDGAGASTKTEWWPVYLDRGQLSFNLAGKPTSPLSPMQFETAFLQGGKGALTMSIDFTQSTQYSSPFAVLSQSQDGAPEGDLMGLNIGVDGLVSATYSNGSQASLGKVALANFSSPTGLRQIGDASYLASATSGTAKVGEAGSAGFGSIRAGATERANVDLTQELVDLITAQRNFQANSKAIETSSTMTQAIINIRS